MADLIDTHCHLNHEDFLADSGAAIQRAYEAGVQHLVVVGYDLVSSEEAVRLAEANAVLFAAIGIHPHDARHYDSDAGERIRDLARNPCVVAIGEIGLDYHYDFSPRDDQHAAFHAQLAIARDLGLPVVIHCREAYADVLDVLDTEIDRQIGGVMHCWAGTPEEAARSVALGLHIGFGGVITFKNAESTRQAALEAPAGRILVETDSPYLAPVPYRGKRNEPSHLPLIARKLAEVRSIPEHEAAAQTTANAQALFRLPD